MDYGKLIGDSFAYAKDGLAGNAGIWVMPLILAILPAIPILCLVIAMILTLKTMPGIMCLAGGVGTALIITIILSAFYGGYMLKVLRGETPLPPVVGFRMLFKDGIRYIGIQIIYMIPALIVFCVTVLPVILTIWMTILSGQKPAEVGHVVFSILGGILLTLIVGFIIWLFAIMGVVRFARTGVFGEAFRFSPILDTIRKIGWGVHLPALPVMMNIVAGISVILSVIPIIGGILRVIVLPFFSVFSMRYVCLLYESAGTV